MAVHRLIFRVDYSLNYELIDAPGKVMRLLAKTNGDNFWDSIKDAKQNRLIGAQYIDHEEGHFRMVSADPTTLLFTVEDRGGLDFRHNRPSGSLVGSLLDLCQVICDEFKIQEVRRAGLRLWHFDQTFDKDLAVDKVCSSVNENLLQLIKDKAGAVRDVGIAFDGGVDDHAKYHIKFGPCSKTELDSGKFFEHLSKVFDESRLPDFICDVDLYEENFSLKGRRLSSWFKLQLSKFDELVNPLIAHLKA